MAEKSIKKILPYKHIKEAGAEALKYIDDRRFGRVRSLQTKWKKLNARTMNGIEWNTIMTIGGMSGSGKSSMANELETSLFDCNPRENFSVLSFNFEMLAMKQVGRKISSKMDKTVTELYSGTGKLSDTAYSEAEMHINSDIKNYDIYYVDIPGTVQEIFDTIMDFHVAQKKIKGDYYGTVIVLDHTLLTRGAQGAGEREILSRLYGMFMFLKKKIKCIFIALSQLNREIEKSERLTNPMQQYPMKKDIFGSDAVFQASDYVLISHKPYMLHLQTYGPNHLPVINPTNAQQPMIYWHLIKNRDGEAGLVLSMVDNLKYNKIEEYKQPLKQ
jgi:replicative DNA helicase